MRDDTARMLVNRAQFDNSHETRDRIRERTPAVRAIEHTVEYLDLVGSCHSFVATLGRLVPQMRGQQFTDDERESIRRQIGRVRAAADWLEGALDNGEFTLDEQLVQRSAQKVITVGESVGRTVGAPVGNCAWSHQACPTLRRRLSLSPRGCSPVGSLACL
jgi:hypothetical protein